MKKIQNMFLAKYKFHLAFENAVCDDYFTEKFVRPFHVGAIPIYYGSRTIRDFAPMRDVVIVGECALKRQFARHLYCF